MTKLSRDELIELIKKIRLGEGNDDEVSGWIMNIKQSVPHPEVLSLVTRNTEQLSVEQITDKLINYQPIVTKEN